MSTNLTLIDEIDVNLAEKLKDVEIVTIDDLARTNIEILETIPGIEHNFAETLIAKATEFLREKESPVREKKIDITSKYSLKTTAQRASEEKEK